MSTTDIDIAQRVSWRSTLRRVLRWLGGAALTLSLALGGAVLLARNGVSERLKDNVASLDPSRVALVLGASVHRDKRPSLALRERVDKAVELLRSGRVQKLLLSGDNRDMHYNEVAAMKRYAVELGAPEQDLVIDVAGLRTYDSCFRAKEIFNVSDLVVVTQSFHLPRAVYLCSKMGITTQGLASDGAFSPSLKLRFREVLAWVLAVVDVHLIAGDPLLGPQEPIVFD